MGDTVSVGVKGKQLPSWTRAMVAMACLAVSALLSPVAQAASPFHWSAPASVAQDGFNSMSCASGSLCVGGTSGGHFVSTDDPKGGAGAWNEVIVPDAVGEAGLGMSCPSESLCVSSGATGRVFTTTNPTGGAGAWTTTVVDDTHSLTDVSCPTEDLCVAVGNDGNVFASASPTGGAGTWVQAAIAGAPYISAVSCPTETLCVAGDHSGDVITSTNPTGGNAAWSAPVNVDGANTLDGVSCPTESLCVATSVDSGDVITSTDPTGGASAWDVASAVYPDGLYRISCPSEALCVAGADGNNGDIVTSTAPTGGASAWEATHIDGTHEMFPVSCPSTRLCVAGDDVGRVLFGVPSGSPPNTKITDSKIKSKHHKARFEFKGIGRTDGFMCKLKSLSGKVAAKRAGFKRCDSPKTYKHLDKGKYKFLVAAFNSAGVDGTPAEEKFEIKG
jgi:hypothetical protein